MNFATATKSLGNSVAEFEYLSCQGPSQSRYQADTFDGEGVCGGGRRERRRERRGKKTRENEWYFISAV